MEVWAIAAIVVILAGIALSTWRKFYYTIVASITCVIVFAIQRATLPHDYVSLMPHDLVDPGRIYTVLTSMYAHDPYHLDHLLFNLIGLVFIGLLFEQRIGTRPFILLYILSGFVGTLAFAAYYWNGVYSVLGASGAISGVLGGFARMYPNERLMLIFLPGYPIRAVYVVFIFVLLQLLFVTGAGSTIAWQSHLAGLAAGILLAPLVVKVGPENKGTKVRVSLLALRKLAVTPELKTMLKRIESEEVPDVRKAWVSHFMSKARCPICGAPVKISGESVRCSKGHIL